MSAATGAVNECPDPIAGADAPLPADSAVDGALRRASRAWLAVLVIVVLLGVGVYTALPQLAEAEAAAGALRRLRPWPILAAVLALAGSYLAGGYTLHALAGLTGDRLSVRAGTRLVLGASGVGLLTGSVGFFAAKYHWGRARGLSIDGAMLLVWGPAVLNTVVLLAFAAVGLGVLAGERLRGWRPGVPLLLLLLLLPATAIAVGFVASGAIRSGSVRTRPKRVEAALRRAAKWMPRKLLGGTFAHVSAMRARLGLLDLRWPLAGALAAVGLDVIALVALFGAAGERVGPAAALAGYALPQVLGAASLIPGGLGVVEGGMLGVFVALGMPAPKTVLVVLVYRGFAFWLPTLIGLPVALQLQTGAVWRRGGARSPRPSGTSTASPASRTPDSA